VLEDSCTDSDMGTIIRSQDRGQFANDSFESFCRRCLQAWADKCSAVAVASRVSRIRRARMPVPQPMSSTLEPAGVRLQTYGNRCR
jgi:hypothetical protein